ncbi:MAG TPA: hypothetical protein VLI06_08065 [Solimonas sp.]|nr:hypothetical protein [Solimonas sp.]
MKKTLIASVLALASGAAMAQGSNAGALPRTDSTLPPASDVYTEPAPPVTVVIPGPAPVQPVMSDDSKFASMDANANGSLSKTEVGINSELVTRFRSLDRNSDGKLSRNEYGMRNVDTSGGR